MKSLFTLLFLTCIHFSFSQKFTYIIYHGDILVKLGKTDVKDVLENYDFREDSIVLYMRYKFDLDSGFIEISQYPYTTTERVKIHEIKKNGDTLGISFWYRFEKDSDLFLTHFLLNNEEIELNYYFYNDCTNKTIVLTAVYLSYDKYR